MVFRISETNDPNPTYVGNLNRYWYCCYHLENPYGLYGLIFNQISKSQI